MRDRTVIIGTLAVVLCTMGGILSLLSIAGSFYKAGYEASEKRHGECICAAWESLP